MDNLCITSNTSTKQFRCRNCNISHSKLYRIKGKSYCGLCVPGELKDKCKIVNQNMEEIRLC